MAYLAFTPIIDGPTGALAWGPVLAATSVAPSWAAGVTLPAAIAGAPYSASVTAAGVPAPTYSIVSGPAWLSIDGSTGALSGTAPSVASDTGVILRATNASGSSDLAVTLSVVVGAAILTTTLPAAIQDQPYLAAIEVTGPEPLTLTASGLPAGLALVGRNITGTPTNAAGGSVLLTLTPATGSPVTRTIVVAGGVAADLPAITTATLPDGEVGVDYAAELAATGASDTALSINFLAGTLDQRVTFTRASTATRFNAAGVLETLGNNAPRFDHDPITLAPRGLLIEGQRTNSIRNNTMQGAVAATPGTLPTEWIAQNLGGINPTEIASTGTENGVSYIDVRFTGTTSTNATGAILTGSVTQIAASSGQTWASSAFVRLVGGSTANIASINNSILERDAGGTLLAATNTSISPTGAALNTQRYATTRTLNQATTAFVQQRIAIVPDAFPVAIDITLRIGLPQLEQGAFATSVIPTTGAAATRAADVAVMTGANFSDWYNAGEGTLLVEAVSSNSSAVTNHGYFSLTTAFGFGRGYAALARTGVVRFLRRDAVSNVATQLSFSETPTRLATTISAASGDRIVNGGAINTDSTALTLDPVQTLHIGFNNVVGTPAENYLNGHIRRIDYYSRRLSNAELMGITSTPPVPVFRWSVAAGSLPPGLALIAGASRYAYISGAPTVAGPLRVTLRAANAVGESLRTYGAQISDPDADPIPRRWEIGPAGGGVAWGQR
jgi:hypothetical protein